LFTYLLVELINYCYQQNIVDIDLDIYFGPENGLSQNLSRTNSYFQPLNDLSLSTTDYMCNKINNPYVFRIELNSCDKDKSMDNWSFNEKLIIHKLIKEIGNS